MNESLRSTNLDLQIPGRSSRRLPGPKPCSPTLRQEAVRNAVDALRRAGAHFSVQDVADRAGISRATVYRSAELRNIVGVHGEAQRAVDRAAHLRLVARHEDLKGNLRDLRSRLDDAEEQYKRLHIRYVEVEERNRRLERTSAVAPEAGELQSAIRSLRSSASRFGADDSRKARRQIARVLHPDLFPGGSAAHDLASEILKILNASIG